MLEAQILITKSDGTVPNATAKVGPVCNILSSLFETVNLRVNDVLITTNGSHYGYKDYLQTLISSTGDAKSMLQSKVSFQINN